MPTSSLVVVVLALCWVLQSADRTDRLVRLVRAFRRPTRS